MLRRSLEERLKQVLKELEAHPNAILFIDEIHTVIGAGATSGGAMDASNLLKPALASGTIRCMGSTTYKEYRQHFEKDRALVRRFQKIDINEPTVEDAVKTASSNPARVMRFSRKGTIVPGNDADLVVFDRDFRPLAVVVAGELKLNEF